MHQECKLDNGYLTFSRNTHKEHFTGLVRVSGLGHVVPQTSSGLLADLLPSARTPCPLPAAPGCSVTAPPPRVTDAELFSAAVDTAAARTKANLLDL